MTVHILPVHESVAIGGATVRKQEGDLTNQCHSNGGDILENLVSSHWHKGDEVPEHVGVLEVGHLHRDCIDG